MRQEDRLGNGTEIKVYRNELRKIILGITEEEMRYRKWQIVGRNVRKESQPERVS